MPKIRCIRAFEMQSPLRNKLFLLNIIGPYGPSRGKGMSIGCNGMVMTFTQKETLSPSQKVKR